ncbi:2-oxoglutarate ferredoxin oxidoreductase subunit beta [Lysinibacillus louembei]|uniref:2-oxoglutarate ferredoxin oxidoreductase subunit beta n=1 Tax=Lysinibacillus louembei TaxID=1470088 RepID=A0ABZ0RUH9_9BACI|nr:2-oxoglutarate ferredoxin oxidoreductase subunit beta [Lysinibacillus louembei]WPK11877.1 2-oxoglutarate ferredoxin oxidoreductase subunit beta [Lysinibacillus louembei]
MTNIIDFIARHEQKELTKLQRTVECSYDQVDELKRFVEAQQLQIKDHTLFLAFLLYLQEHHIDALTIFKDVFSIPRYKFEHLYNMKWWSVAQLGFTFLAILKDNEPAEYERFFNKMKSLN